MIYLRNFFLATLEQEASLYDTEKSKMRMSTMGALYPFDIFPEKGFEEICFESPVTIFYGGNGSGKTTLLNIIAEKLNLKREAVYNRSHWFDEYLRFCSYYSEEKIPKNSLVIASDDVFDYMLKLRSVNEGIDVKRDSFIREYFEIKDKYSNADELRKLVNNVDFKDTKSAAEFERKWSILKRTTNKFVKTHVQNNIREHSNGESAFTYFFEKIDDSALYLLDEPENSLSPAHQEELVEYIYNCACGDECQFIIASHSPFVLAMKNAQIYDLDSDPVVTKKWTELESILQYRKFFKKHEKEFEEE